MLTSPTSFGCFVIVLFLCTLSLSAQSTLSGRVTDRNGIALNGATISIAATNKVTISDADGHFTIESSPGTLIQFSHIGFITRQISIGTETELVVSLEEEKVMLDEIVVVGYGSALRKDVTGAVSKISENEFNAGVITHPLQQIQGKIAGVVITQPGGDPNRDFTVRIRGATSVEGQPPLLVLDGVAIDDFNRAITLINPADIASYDILKDASAAAIYGSRGANGVILITTKKAIAGKLMFEYNGFGTAEKTSNAFDMLTGDEWRDATKSDPRANTYDAGADTDWQDEISRSAYTQSHFLSASGGNNQIQARGSVGYMDHEGVIINTGKTVLTARLNADFTSANEKLRLQYGLNTSIINRDLLPDQSSTGPVWQGGAVAFGVTSGYLPVWPVYQSTGSYFQPPFAADNPVSFLNESYSKQKQNFFQTSINGNYELTEGLNIGALAAISTGTDVYDMFRPQRIGTTSDALAGRSNSNKQNVTTDLHLNYKRSFGDHTLDVTGAYEYNDFVNDGFRVNVRGPVVEGLLLNTNLGSATSVSLNDIGSFKNEVKLISLVGRLVYNYKNRYILTANFRRDGSSKFGSNNRWGNFPSAAIAWRLTNENFSNNKKWLDVKLRVSYGLTGNQENLPPYNYRTLYAPAGGYDLPNGAYGQSYGVVQEGNADLKWEVRKSLNIGMDFSLWNDRITGVIDVFNDRTSDMLFLYNIPQPPFVTDRAYANAADAVNKGIEFSLGGDVINKTEIKWSARGNLGVIRNKIVNLLGQFKGFDLTVTNAHYGYATGGSFQIAPVTQLKSGYPAGVFWLPKHAGFDDKGRELYFAYASDGKVIGTDSIFTAEDRVHIDPTPNFEWGITNTFTFQNFDLSIFIRGVQGQKIFANSLLNLESRAYLPERNVTTRALSNLFVNKPNISTYWLRDGSYARVENVTLGYTFRHIKGGKLRIYLEGRNLLLVTSYGGIDPEVNVEGVDRYIDQYYYPRTRGITLGLNLTFYGTRLE